MKRILTFKQTMDLIEEIKFDASFSFIYSPRPGTPASQLEDTVQLETKKERLYILQKRIDELQLHYSNNLSWHHSKMFGYRRLKKRYQPIASKN